MTVKVTFLRTSILNCKQTMVSLKNIQTEIDASFLYGILAKNEEDENVASVFRQMSEIEHLREQKS